MTSAFMDFVQLSNGGAASASTCSVPRLTRDTPKLRPNRRLPTLLGLTPVTDEIPPSPSPSPSPSPFSLRSADGAKSLLRCSSVVSMKSACENQGLGRDSISSTSSGGGPVEFRSGVLLAQAKLSEVEVEMKQLDEMNEPALSVARVECICKLLSIMTETPSWVQPYIKTILNSIRLFIFTSQVPEAVQRQLGYTHKLVKPYFEIAQDYFKASEREQQQRIELQTSSNIIVEDLKTELAKRELEITQLRDELRAVSDENKSLQVELLVEKKRVGSNAREAQLREELGRIFDENNTLLNDQFALNQERQKLIEANEASQKRIESLQQDMASLNRTILELQEQQGSMVDSYKCILSHVSTAHAAHKKVIQQKEEMESTNAQLRLRASVAFEDLTPRPDWNQIMKETQLPCPTSGSTDLDKHEALLASSKRLSETLAAELQRIKIHSAAKESKNKTVSKPAKEKPHMRRSFTKHTPLPALATNQSSGNPVSLIG